MAVDRNARRTTTENGFGRLLDVPAAAHRASIIHFRDRRVAGKKGQMHWHDETDGFGSEGVEFDLYTNGFGGVSWTPRRSEYLLNGPDEGTDEEGSPDYDPPQDPEPAPDGPSSPTSN